MSGSATENIILLSVLPRLTKIFNQSINQLYDWVWIASLSGNGVNI